MGGFLAQMPLIMAWYLNYLMLITFSQLHLWWLPYLFGLITEERYASLSLKLENTVKVTIKNNIDVLKTYNVYAS
jgi:hypothetical protein